MLATIENEARFDNVQQLVQALAELKVRLLQFKPDLLPIKLPDDLQIGELQVVYLNLKNALNTYQLSKKVNSYDKQIIGIKQRIRLYSNLQLQLERQKNTRLEDLALAEKILNTSRKLFSDRVIAEVEFTRSQQEYLHVKQQLEAIEISLANNQILIKQFEAQIIDLDVRQLEINERLLTDIKTYHRQLESQLITYQQTYWLEAPIAGRVTLLRFLNNRRYITAGTELITIVPSMQPIYGQAFVPIARSGKVEVGQKVNVKFDNFPYNEFGFVVGYIAAVSSVPRDGVYTVRITFPKGLITNYNKKLLFRQEMTGSADVITADISLFNRVFYQIRSIFVRFS
ncbi:HlyD family efflux transporter periplasmic adaptor subunit [Spirosoma linguale]|uniref:Secretion protein HlyD family protein n=1 Tax=Spirosoma linguale (strain ATCC 33905 / DSM 74 / LMG 10896 / Claus 1) TaxID=504472 RepID=D2QKQ1_SPILD|nr:hypothetical protein Slin_4232 [Spirosoma linguale DSM 74]